VSARSYTLNEIWNIGVRNRWVILVPVAIGLAAAPFLARFAPLRYRSEALILVVPPQVPGSYVQRTVVESIEDRLPSITARILSRSRLETIILDLDLYKKERAREVMEDVVERMRLRDVQTTATGKDVDSFRVSYESDNPETAQKVTERLTAFYVEQNVLERANQAEGTTQLIAAQLENTKQRLSEQEKKVEAYRKAHPGQLPSQLGGNLQAIQNSQMQLQNLNEQINRAHERRLRVEREIASLDALPLPPPSALPGSAEPTTAELLEAARAARASLVGRYKPDHPEFQRVERQIAELTAKLESEAPLSARTPEKPVNLAEAVQQQKRLGLQAELSIADGQLKEYRRQEEQLRKTMASYQAKVDVLPTRESELTELTREYNTLSAAYSDLLLKRENASLAANLERRQFGENFTVVDPASRPERPFNEVQRYGVMFSGAAAGLVLAVVVIGLREWRDSSFRSKDEVIKVLSLPVLASIPAMASPQERQATVRRRWAMDIGGSALLIASVGFVVVWQLFQ
jgi:polysaccharide chain length determinant protein (PEP-CTERM system associated)